MKIPKTKVSVAVRAFNSGKTIEKCLNILLEQKMQKGTELLVVLDTNSTDNSEKILEKFSKRKKIRLEKHARKGFANALNFAVEKARGEIVVFCDDDMFVSKNWLSELIEPFKNSKIDGVSGPVLPLETNFFGKCVSALGYPGGGYKRLFEEGFTKHPSMNLAIRRKVLEKTGEFDKSLKFGNEDTDFFKRALEKGFNFWFNPRATVKHKVRDNLPEFISWWLRRGKADVEFHKKHMKSYPYSLFSPKSSSILRLLVFIIISILLSFNWLLESSWLFAVLAWILAGVAREQKELEKIKKFLEIPELAYWTCVPALRFLGKLVRETGRIMEFAAERKSV